MSFSSQLKAELSALKTGKPCCLDSELKALTRCCATLSLQGRGELRLKYRSGSPSVAKRIYVLLKALYGLSPAAHYTLQARFGGRKLYALHLDKGDTEKLLAAFGAGANDRRPGIAVRLSLGLARRECCRRAYLRGMLIGCGSVADPEKGYQAEFILPDRRDAPLLRKVLSMCGVDSALAPRRGSEVVYIRGGEKIVRLLILAGASRSVLATENLRLENSLKNQVNRAMNCDSANMARRLQASMKQVKAIDAVSLSRGLSALPSALEQLARLRLANREASLEELGAMLDPPLSKSAVQQRMNRIIAIAGCIQRSHDAPP